MTNNNFRLQSKKLFLTYSQCVGEKEDLLNFLHTKLKILEYIVAKENHKDGGTHFHVYLALEKRCNITNPGYLDWEPEGIEAILYHPKIEACKSSFKVQQYCKKDGDYITNMKFNIFQCAKELAKTGKWKEALIYVLEKAPQEIKYLEKWEHNFKAVAKLFTQKTQKTLYNKEDFVNCQHIKHRPGRCMVISGKSGWGKTQYAKTLFNNPLIVRHIDKLKRFNEIEHDGIIFDDMDFSHYPRVSCIHLLDTEEDTDINVKCSMITIPAGTRRVFTTNSEGINIFSSSCLAIRRRLNIYTLQQSLIPSKPSNVKALFTEPTCDSCIEGQPIDYGHYILDDYDDEELNEDGTWSYIV